MVQWTDSQQLAIDSRNKNLLVSAAAGSGKTAVLVERIIQLLVKDEVNIDGFLIVTFTNAAAGEMRERINKALFEAIEKGLGKESHLRRQIQLLDRASISTLHSFCIEIVRKNFHLIDIDPIFRIGDEVETKLLKMEVLEEIFETEYEKASPDFLALVEMYGGNRDDQGLKELVLGLDNFIQSKPYPEEWLREKIQDFSQGEEGFYHSPWYKNLLAQLKIELSGAQKLFLEAKDIAQRPGGPEGYGPMIENDLLLVEDLLEKLEEDLDSLYRGLLSVKHQRLGRVKDVEEDLKETCKNLRNEGKEIIKSITDKLLVKSPKEFVDELMELHPHIESLCQLTLSFGEGYALKKQEKGILDFNDLEHYALKILENPEAAREYREKFNYIFVDEYQDSNLIQETIVNKIKRENNVFLVGDVKQSIYRFRLADPSIFIGKYESFLDTEEGVNRRIDLSKNFRSRKEIIEGVNFIFRHLMSKELGEIDYDDRASLYLGSNFEDIEEPQIELNLIERNEGALPEDLEDQEDIENMNHIEIEGHWVAKRIQKLLEKEIYDAKQGGYRRIQYRDIVVLLRTTKNWAQIFMETFIAQGIPAYADVHSGYFETLEVNVFMNLLKIIDNKRQDIPLLSVLRSPIFNFTAHELIKIRGNSTEVTFYEAIEEYIENNQDNLQEKLIKVLDKLAQWKEQARYIPIEEFLWKILIDTGYYYYIGAMPGGMQRQANIRVLMDRAQQFQKTSMKGLFHFISFVDQLKSSSGDMGTAKILGENDNVVRMMSIHKSKGLEFPVVILAGMGKNFNLQDTNKPILFHKDLGLGPNYINYESRIYHESIAKIAMKNRMKMENLSEEMRILYVALTRPKDKLIMVGSLRNLPDRIAKWGRTMDTLSFSRAKNLLDWIGPVVLRHAQGESLREMGGIHWGEEKYIEDPSQWEINCYHPQDIVAEERQKQQDKKQLLNQLQNFSLDERDGDIDPSNIFQRLDWSYQNEMASKLPSKLSVTDVKNSRESKRTEALGVNIPMMTARPTFMEGTKVLTGQEKGVAMHFVLQHLDLHAVESKEQIKLQIQSMVSRELIRESEVQAVDIDKLLRFFHSSLGRRMLASSRVEREVAFNLVKDAKEVLENIEGIQTCQEEILIQGVIDCYFQEEDELVLIDYKTDFYPNQQVKEKIIRNYSPQIQLYKEALEKIHGKKVKECYLYLFYGEEAVSR
ncbi:helicase-exonuclease AddAB subunit AddA [Irregularibacter muris]|uniref:ATP-dependent helicase/nuclease subunit A n=1 Tax=Irregularibacter muris TaxID=1796619 RepID=A0AAE3HJ79_9FIRM|nr:helicase-exonuclease AddAB subunit AddA [Irregularibacter muris]MCR1899693.1 helicase-exonuclease AddAB subunit AddA [Irregularibacter muris]